MERMGAGPRREKFAWWRWPWLPVFFFVIAALVTLWSQVAPGGYFGLEIISLLAWLAVIIIWLAVGILAVIALPSPRLRRLGRLWPLLLVPALMVVVSVVTKTDTVLRVGFALHRPALEQLVADTAQAPNAQLGRQTIGLYNVSSSYQDQLGCTRIVVRDAGFLNASGFAYCQVPPVSAGGDNYTQLDGNWYTMSLEW